MERSAVRFCLTFALLVVVVTVLVPFAPGQPNIQGQWSELPYTMPINPVHAALMPTGQVLVVSGSGNFPSNRNFQAAVWDPVANTVTTLPLGWDMFCNGMIVMADGKPMVAGGTAQYDPFHGHSRVSTFDPTAGTFTDIQNMAHGRWYPTLTMLSDGRVMVFSGIDETGNATNQAVEFYTPNTGWSQPFSAPWTPPLYPRMHLLPSGKVLYSSPGSGSSLFDPVARTWSTNFAFTNYSGTRTYGSSVLLPLDPSNNYNARVMVLGGNSPATKTTEIIDMGASKPAWQWGPPMSQERIEMNAVILPTGKVLAIGGSLNDEDTSTASLNADLIDAEGGSTTSAGANAYARLYHSVALLLPDATVWLAGGNPDRGVYQPKMEIYQPAYLFTTSDGNVVPATRPTIGSAPANVGWGSSFTVGTPDAANITSAALVRDGATTHAFDMDQRLVRLAFTAGTDTLTATAPPNGNIAPPGYYMLFLLNNAGVPSVARFVQVGLSDFSLSSAPPSLPLDPGSSGAFAVNVATTGNFGSDVTLTVSGLPQGATANFNPTVVTGAGATSLNIDTSTSTPPGSYSLTITGTSGSAVRTTTATLVVNAAPADFSIAAIPPVRGMNRGGEVRYKATITPVNGFSGAVTFSLAGLPAKTRAAFNPAVINGSGMTVLRVQSAAAAPPGTYTLTITGTSGSLSHSTTVSLKIQ